MNIFQEKRKAQGWYARCSSAPDTTGLNAAAQSQAALSKESLDWYKQIYADTAGQRQTATDSANRMSALQEQSAINQNALTSKLSGRMDKQFGLEDKAIQEADNYDTVDRQNANAGRAMADVTQQAGIARDEQARSLQRAGVDPSSGRALAIQGNTGLAEAGMKAGAANKARLDTQTLGYARKMDALGLGRGLAANQATSAGVALNAGNSSVSNGMSALTPQNQATAQMGQGFGLASNSLSSAGNMYGNIASIQNQANSNDNAAMGGLGNVAGAAILKYSDKNVKTDRKPITGKIALSMVKNMPVESWKYKPGVEDGGHHIGPMAQDVRKAAGDSVAPGGKMIDLVSMNGLSLASIQHLDKRLAKVEKRMGLAEHEPAKPQARRMSLADPKRH